MARPADPRKSVPGQPRLQRFTPEIAEIPLRPAGLEPATLGLEIPCSIRLSYGRENGCGRRGFADSSNSHRPAA
jgi:hypothetical protein